MRIRRPVFLIPLYALPVALLCSIRMIMLDLFPAAGFVQTAFSALMLLGLVCALGGRGRDSTAPAALWGLFLAHAALSALEIAMAYRIPDSAGVAFLQIRGTYAYQPVGYALFAAFADALPLLGLGMMLFAAGGRTRRELGRQLALGAGIGLVPATALGIYEGSVYLVKNVLMCLTVATLCGALGLAARAALDAVRARREKAGAPAAMPEGSAAESQPALIVPAEPPAVLDAPVGEPPAPAVLEASADEPPAPAVLEASADEPPAPAVLDAPVGEPPAPVVLEASAGEPPAPEPPKPKRKYPLYYHPALVLPVCVALPLIGLTVNLALGDLVGRFDHPAFFAIALINGLLMLPPFRNRRPELALLSLKSAGFSFICYFTLAFMPYLPLGVIGLVYALAGALLLTPAAVFVLESLQLMDNVRAARTRHGAPAIAAAIAAGALTLPLLFAGGALLDRAALETAVAQVTASSAPQRVDTGRLSRVLDDMNAFKADPAGRGGVFISGSESLPLLSPLYRAVAYGNRALDRATVAKLYQTYYAEAADIEPNLSAWSIVQPGFRLTALSARTEYDAATGLYASWVDVELRNTLDRGNREYKTSFDFPADCFVTDYYLYVNGRMKPGLISERAIAKAAYEGVVRRALDPGLLEYKDGGSLELRVFPFAAGEARRTGFKVLHPRALTLTIEGKDLTLQADRGAYAPADLGEHENCAPGCKAALPYGGNAYENARALRHNARESGNDLETIAESLRQRVLTGETAFIVLETQAQEDELLERQALLLSGKAAPGEAVRMDESVGLAAGLALLALLLGWRYRSARGPKRAGR